MGDIGARSSTEDSMNGDRQSRKEANTKIEPLVHPRKQIKVACWNVRTMNADGKTEQIVDEMNNYGIDILGISESRWTGTGKITFKGRETMLYSGVETRHEFGVGIIISKKNRSTLLEWHPVNERIITARFFSKHIDYCSTMLRARKRCKLCGYRALL